MVNRLPRAILAKGDSWICRDHQRLSRPTRRVCRFAGRATNPRALHRALHRALGVALPRMIRRCAIRERIGLDYFGIDCGLDPKGNLLVFEVNASMLVHDDIKDFPYKDPFVRVIKAAFGAMLQNRAAANG